MVNIFTPSGRIGRISYLLHVLCLVLPFFILDFFKFPHNEIIMILQFAVVYFLYMISIKRLHDINISGWTIFFIAMVLLAPIYSRGICPEWLVILSEIIYRIGEFILLAVLFLLKGTKGPNKYGESPIMPIKFLQKIKNTEN